MSHMCKCMICDGEGEAEYEIDCPCEGCFNGEHQVEVECGVEAFAPCHKCDGTGYATEKGECEDCGGEGLDHDYKKDGATQKTFKGDDLKVFTCKRCGHKLVKGVNDE